MGAGKTAVLWHSLEGGTLNVHYYDLDTDELRTRSEGFDKSVLTDGLDNERAMDVLMRNAELGIPTERRTVEGLAQLRAYPGSRGIEHQMSPEFVTTRNADHTPRTRWFRSKESLENAILATESLGFRDAGFFGTGFRGGHKEYMVQFGRRRARLLLSALTRSDFNDFAEEVKQDEVLLDAYQVYGLRLLGFKDEKEASAFLDANRDVLTPWENNATVDIVHYGTGFDTVREPVIRFVSTRKEAVRMWHLRLEHQGKELKWYYQGHNSHHSYPDSLGQGHWLLQAQTHYPAMRTLEGKRLTDEEFAQVRDWILRSTGYLDIEAKGYLKFMPRTGDIAQIAVGNSEHMTILCRKGCAPSADFTLPNTTLLTYDDELEGVRMAWEATKQYPFVMWHYGDNYDGPMLRRLNHSRSIAETEMLLGRLKRKKSLTKDQYDEAVEEAYRIHAQINLLRSLHRERGKVWEGNGVIALDLQRYWKNRRDALRTDTRLVTVTLLNKEGVQDYDELEDNYATEEGRRTNTVYLRQDVLLLQRGHRDVVTEQLLEMEATGVGIDRIPRTTPYTNVRAFNTKERRAKHGRHLYEEPRRHVVLEEQKSDVEATVKMRRKLRFADSKEKLFEGWSLYYNPLIISSQRNLLEQREGLFERFGLLHDENLQSKVLALQRIEAAASPIIGAIERTLQEASQHYISFGDVRKGRDVLRLRAPLDRFIFDSFRTDKPERPWRSNPEDLDALLGEKCGFSDFTLHGQYMSLFNSYQRLREKGFPAQVGAFIVSVNSHPESVYCLGTGNICVVNDRLIAHINGRPVLYNIEMHKGEEHVRDELLSAVRDVRLPEYRHTNSKRLNKLQLSVAEAFRGQVPLL